MQIRDLSYLHPELQRAWRWLRVEYGRRYPGHIQPEISETYRTLEDQAIKYKTGKSGARPGESLHNYNPAGAFDIYFNDTKNTPSRRDDTANWDFIYYQRFGELAESIGLVWGGRFPNLVDGPHIQLPMTWKQAKEGKYPTLPPLPSQAIHAELNVVVLENWAETEVVIRKPFYVSIDNVPLESGKKIHIRFKDG